MGSTNRPIPLRGTIRGDYALNLTNNIIHGSDSLESAAREIDIYFTPAEVVKIAGGYAQNNRLNLSSLRKIVYSFRGLGVQSKVLGCGNCPAKKLRQLQIMCT